MRKRAQQPQAPAVVCVHVAVVNLDDGTIAGGKTGMDVFGCLVIGTVTATGGGTLRDIVLGGERLWCPEPNAATEAKS